MELAGVVVFTAENFFGCLNITLTIITVLIIGASFLARINTPITPHMIRFVATNFFVKLSVFFLGLLNWLPVILL